MLQRPLLLKKLQFHPYAVWAGILISIAALIRVIITLLGWTATNSDEALMNLAALHIAYRGETPIFFYGQYYLGTLEAYVGAALFRIFGASLLVMRLEMVAFYVGFLICIYILTSRMYSKRFALVILALFCAGSRWMLTRQLESAGYPELPLLVALVFLITYILAVDHYKLSWKKRALLYTLWGLVSGLALWTHFLVAPYLLVSGIFLLALCWRDIWRWSVWLILLGFTIGAAPLIYYNLTAAPGMDSWSIYLQMSNVGQSSQYTFLDHLLGTIFVALPVASGFTSNCISQGLWTHPPLFPTTNYHCVIEQGIWGGGYVVLVVLGLILASVGFWRARKQDVAIERHQQRAQHFASIMLLIGALISIASFVKGSPSATGPLEDWRYLMCTWLSVPAVLWPIWASSNWFKSLRISEGVRYWKVGIFFMIGLVVLQGMFSIADEIQSSRQTTHTFSLLQTRLEELHVTRFYSEYWDCNHMVFATQEQLICGDTYDNLSHGSDRIPEYRTILEKDPHPGFVYPYGAPQIANLDALLKKYHMKYERYDVYGFAVYRLYAHIPSLKL